MNRKFFAALRTVNAKGLGPCLRTLMLLSAVAGLAVLGSVNGPQIRAQAGLGLSAPAPSFEVAAIKPSHPGTPGPSFRFHGDGITIHSATLKAIMGFAFNVRDFQISGGPSWINSDRYDIEAKEPKAVQDGMLKLDFDQRTKLMGQLLQSLLADRFQLKVTHDTKELPVYALVVAKGGPKFLHAKFETSDDPAHRADPTLPRPAGPPCPTDMRCWHNYGSMALVVDILSWMSDIGRPVLDRTGLEGGYYLELQYAPQRLTAAASTDNAPPPGPVGPSIFTALERQLGLKLKPTKGPVESIVIEHIERPTEN